MPLAIIIAAIIDTISFHLFHILAAMPLAAIADISLIAGFSLISW